MAGSEICKLHHQVSVTGWVQCRVTGLIHWWKGLKIPCLRFHRSRSGLADAFLAANHGKSLRLMWQGEAEVTLATGHGDLSFLLCHPWIFPVLPGHCSVCSSCHRLPINQTLLNKGTCDYLCVKAELSLPMDATGRRMALNDFSSFLTTEFGELGSEAAEKELLIGAEGSLKRKSTLPSFKLPSLIPKEKGIAAAGVIGLFYPQSREFRKELLFPWHISGTFSVVILLSQDSAEPRQTLGRAAVGGRLAAPCHCWENPWRNTEENLSFPFLMEREADLMLYRVFSSSISIFYVSFSLIVLSWSQNHFFCKDF